MNLEFFYSIFVIVIVFFILSSGFKFFLNLKWELDFSYFAIIIFWSYISIIVNNLLSIWIIWSIFVAFLLSIFFTFFVLYFSSKLSNVYFIIWTLSIYILSLHFARNIEITWWAMWISAINQNIIWDYSLQSWYDYFLFSSIILLIIIIILIYIKKTLFYKALIWWWENELILKSLWINVKLYKLFMIILTTFLAIVWWWIYSFYFMYISVESFWLTLISTVIVISFLSYKFNEIGTFIISFLVIFGYEYLRFLKIVDQTHLWYFREIIFSILIMISSYFMFRNTDFWRDV